MQIYGKGFNPFPHIDAFWRLCSRRLFENIVTKEEIAISPFATMFSTFCHRLSIQLWRFFYFLTKYVQSRLLQNCRMREKVKILNMFFYAIFTLFVNGQMQNNLLKKIILLLDTNLNLTWSLFELIRFEFGCICKMIEDMDLNIHWIWTHDNPKVKVTYPDITWSYQYVSNRWSIVSFMIHLYLSLNEKQATDKILQKHITEQQFCLLSWISSTATLFFKNGVQFHQPHLVISNT